MAENSKALEDPAVVAGALRLFAWLFYHEVDPPLLAELRSMRDALTEALPGNPLAGLDCDEVSCTLEALAVEYCRLFIGPYGHLPPVESVVTGEGHYWGQSTQAVVNFYRSVGFEQTMEVNVLPDHISLELDCLACLEEEFRHEEARNFAREHTCRWVPLLVRHVRERATLPFYEVWGQSLCALLAHVYDEGN